MRVKLHAPMYITHIAAHTYACIPAQRSPVQGVAWATGGWGAICILWRPQKG